MAAIQYRQLVLSQGTVAKPGLSLADYTQAGSVSVQRYASTTGISGTAATILFGVTGTEKLKLDSFGATASALAVTTPTATGTVARVITWDVSNTRIGILAAPTSDGLAIVGTVAGGLSWGTVTPGFHTHRMSASPAQMIFDAALTPQTGDTYTLGAVSYYWKGLYVTGLSVIAGVTTITAASVASAAQSEVLIRNTTTGVVSTITSPGGADKILWSKNSVLMWADAPSGGTGGIPEAPQNTLTYGRKDASWIQVLHPPYTPSQLNLNSDVLPNGTVNLGNAANRWGLYATFVNASTTLTVSGAATVGGLTSLNAGLTLGVHTSLASITPDANHLALVRHDSTGVVSKSTAANMKSWLGLTSALTGSGNHQALAYWNNGVINGSSAIWTGTVFQFTANIQVTSGKNISITGGETLWVDGVKLPSLKVDAIGYHALYSSGTVGAEGRLSWLPLPVTAQTRVVFTTNVPGLTASPNSLTSGDVSVGLTGSPYPTGGSIGQVLAKKTVNTVGTPATDLEWKTFTSGIAYPTAAGAHVADSGGWGLLARSGTITISSSAPYTIGINDTTYVKTTVSVSGGSSITGGGVLTGSYLLTLVNDNTNPGGGKYYGTDSGGTRGWLTMPVSGGGTVTGSGNSSQLAIWNSNTNIIGFSNSTGSNFLKAGTPPAWGPVAWGDIGSKPTTIAGYGITDAYTKSEVYSKSEVYNISGTNTAINSAFPQQNNPRPAGGNWAHLDRAEFQVNVGWVLATSGGGGVTTQVRFSNSVYGLTGTPTDYDSSGQVTVALSGSPLPVIHASPTRKVLMTTSAGIGGQYANPATNMVWSNVVSTIAATNNAPGLTLNPSSSVDQVTLTLSGSSLPQTAGTSGQVLKLIANHAAGSPVPIASMAWGDGGGGGGGSMWVGEPTSPTTSSVWVLVCLNASSTPKTYGWYQLVGENVWVV